MPLCADLSVNRTIYDLLFEFQDWQREQATFPQPCPITINNSSVCPRLDKYLDMNQAWSKVAQGLRSGEEEACKSKEYSLVIKLTTSKEKCKKEEKADKIDKFHIDVVFSNVSGRLIYLPAYLCSYTYEGSEYSFVVSGQTGSIKGQVPF